MSVNPKQNTLLKELMKKMESKSSADDDENDQSSDQKSSASLNPTTAYFSSSSAAAAAGGGGGGGGNDEGNCEYCVKCELPECNITKAKNKLLVLCDTCSVSIHLECLNLTGVPNQTRWSCPYCIETEKRQLMRKRTFKINDPVDVHINGNFVRGRIFSFALNVVKSSCQRFKTDFNVLYTVEISERKQQFRAFSIFPAIENSELKAKGKKLKKTKTKTAAAATGGKTLAIHSADEAKFPPFMCDVCNDHIPNAGRQQQCESGCKRDVCNSCFSMSKEQNRKCKVHGYPSAFLSPSQVKTPSLRELDRQRNWIWAQIIHSPDVNYLLQHLKFSNAPRTRLYAPYQFFIQDIKNAPLLPAFLKVVAIHGYSQPKDKTMFVVSSGDAKDTVVPLNTHEFLRFVGGANLGVLLLCGFNAGYHATEIMNFMKNTAETDRAREYLVLAKVTQTGNRNDHTVIGQQACQAIEQALEMYMLFEMSIDDAVRTFKHPTLHLDYQFFVISVGKYRKIDLGSTDTVVAANSAAASDNAEAAASANSAAAASSTSSTVLSNKRKNDEMNKDDNIKKQKQKAQSQLNQKEIHENEVQKMEENKTRTLNGLQTDDQRAACEWLASAVKTNAKRTAKNWRLEILKVYPNLSVKDDTVSKWLKKMKPVVPSDDDDDDDTSVSCPIHKICDCVVVPDELELKLCENKNCTFHLNIWVFKQQFLNTEERKKYNHNTCSKLRRCKYMVSQKKKKVIVQNLDHDVPDGQNSDPDVEITGEGKSTIRTAAMWVAKTWIESQPKEVCMSKKADVLQLECSVKHPEVASVPIATFRKYIRGYAGVKLVHTKTKVGLIATAAGSE